MVETFIARETHCAIEIDPVGDWVCGFLPPPVRHMAPRSLLDAVENQFFVYRPFGTDEVISRIESFVDMAAEVFWCLAKFLFGVVL